MERSVGKEMPLALTDCVVRLHTTPSAIAMSQVYSMSPSPKNFNMQIVSAARFLAQRRFRAPSGPSVRSWSLCDGLWNEERTTGKISYLLKSGHRRPLPLGPTIPLAGLWLGRKEKDYRDPFWLVTPSLLVGGTSATSPHLLRAPLGGVSFVRDKCGLNICNCS